jgi:toxin-antitoxin system PIN domain toxin
VIAVDTNILIYAHRSEMPEHRAALSKLTSIVEGNAPWALPLFCIGEFVRVVTHPRVFSPPTSLETALDYLQRLLASPSARLLTPGTAFMERFGEACREGAVRGNLAFDAQVVAVCREHGVSEILTEDRDFARFPGMLPTQLSS